MIGVAIVLLIGVGIGVLLERKKVVIEVQDKVKSWFKK